MVNDNRSIVGGVDIELDSIRSDVKGPKESGNRVLRQGVVQPAVRDRFGNVRLGA